MAGFTAVQLGALGTNINGFGANQLAVLSTAQVAGLTANQIGVLGTNIAVFTPLQLGALSTNQVVGLTTNQIAVLTTNQIGGLSAADLNVLSTTLLSAFSVPQISSLTSVQTNGLSSSQQFVFTTTIQNDGARNQIAIQLGSTNGVITSSSAPSVVSAALSNGLALLSSATTNYSSNTNLLKATIAALTNPVSITVTNNGVITKLSPANTVPSALVAAALQIAPNYAPQLAYNAVAASTAFTSTNIGTNTFLVPRFGTFPTTTATDPASVLAVNSNTYNMMIANASQAASNAMNASLQSFASRTNNPSPLGLADAASAVAAQAINGLGATNANLMGSTSYFSGQTTNSIYNLTKSMTIAAAGFQVASTTTANAVTTPIYTNGALSAQGLGLITQVSGVNNENWGATNNTSYRTSLLNAVVKGVTSALGINATANLASVATGITEGFYATYIATSTNQVSIAKFTQDNVANIALSFNVFGGVTNTSVLSTITNSIVDGIYQIGKVSGAITGTSVQATYASLSGLTNSFGSVSTLTNSISYTNNTIAGAKGVNYFAYLNAVGTPVSDTTGF